MVIIVLVCVSCVKRKNCDCGERTETGLFVYLKEPYKMSGTTCNAKEEKIVACLMYGDSVVFVNGKYSGYAIKGYVPPSFRSKTPIKVKVCLKWDCDDRIHVHVVGPEIFSLKCIERREE
ncbi:MAG: hypothetical protein LBE13_01205 [Bacteroidales bacterium]|nr:hypothetical protein [Bacteroidales bacterium]